MGRAESSRAKMDALSRDWRDIWHELMYGVKKYSTASAVSTMTISTAQRL